MFERALPLSVCAGHATDSFHQVEISVLQEDSGSEAVVVWDAALVLAYYLERWQRLLGLQKGKRALELGAGTGAVGLAAAVLGAKVTLTDVVDYVPLLEKNIEHNSSLLSTAGSGSLEAKQLQWADVEHIAKVRDGGEDFDLILISDCVYYEASVAPLVETLNALATPDTLVLLSYEERTSEEKLRVLARFFQLLKEHELNVEEVPTDQCHQDYASDDIHVLKITKKAA